MRNSNPCNNNICFVIECHTTNDKQPIRLEINPTIGDSTDAESGESTRSTPGVKVLLEVEESIDGTVRSDREVARFHQALISGLLCNASIEKMAEICCLSTSTFKRHFRRRYSASPHSWFIIQRLKIARNLIVESNIAIHRIASLCGFNNTSHFIALFRHHYNTTPSRLRHSLNITKSNNACSKHTDIVIEIDIATQE